MEKDQFMNPEEWEHSLRKYSSLVLQGKMAELNPNDINYFKGQTITDPNSGNKTTLHYAIVENVEGVNLQEDTTFNKNCSNMAVNVNGAVEAEKFLAQYYTENGMEIPEIDL
jgi:hypothetical protein